MVSSLKLSNIQLTGMEKGSIKSGEIITVTRGQRIRIDGTKAETGVQISKLREEFSLGNHRAKVLAT